MGEKELVIDLEHLEFRVDEGYLGVLLELLGFGGAHMKND